MDWHYSEYISALSASMEVIEVVDNAAGRGKADDEVAAPL